LRQLVEMIHLIWSHPQADRAETAQGLRTRNEGRVDGEGDRLTDENPGENPRNCTGN
jgi:hypothetical protein